MAFHGSSANMSRCACVTVDEARLLAERRVTTSSSLSEMQEDDEEVER